jgi:hypothetical protein
MKLLIRLKIKNATIEFRTLAGRLFRVSAYANTNPKMISKRYLSTNNIIAIHRKDMEDNISAKMLIITNGNRSITERWSILENAALLIKYNNTSTNPVLNPKR